jgi:autotransporter-associated beta strand protein
MSGTRSLFLKVAQYTTLVGIIGMTSLSAQESFSARERIWKGGDSLMSNASNWERGEGIPRYATIRELIFGTSPTYQVKNDISDLRIMSLIFTEDAGSYTISGNPFNISIDNVTGVYNRSNVPQTIESQLLVYPKETTLYSKKAPLLLTGGIRYMEEEQTFIKSGAGTVSIGGALKGGQFHLNEGELRFIGQGLSFQNPPIITMQGGTLAVEGGKGKTTGTQRVNLGTLAELSSGHAHRIVVDSKEGSATNLHFDSWSLGHKLSPGLMYKYARIATLNVNVASPKTSVSIGTLPEGMEPGEILPFATVTDSEKTGFATVNSKGNFVRYTNLERLGFGKDDATNFKVLGDHDSYKMTDARTIKTLTIQGAGTMVGPRLRVSSILMEENVGDYTIATDYMLSSASSYSRIFQYSKTGTLTIKSWLGGDHGNYFNSLLVKAGPGTVVLESNDSTMAGGLTVQEGRLDIRGNLLQVTPTIDVYGGIFGGYGQIGGGIRYKWTDDGIVKEETPLYSRLDISNGATLDVSGMDGKSLSLFGRLVMQEGASLQVNPGQSKVSGIAVTRDPQSIDPAVVLAGDLKVVLTQPPVPLSKTLLVSCKDGITGKFASVNGGNFTGDEGTWFTVEHNRRNYTFRIIYTKTSVEIQAGR